MPSTVLDAPALAARFAQAGAGPAQAAVLREAFDECNKAVQGHEQSLQAQAQALQALQTAVQRLQEAQARRDGEYASHREDAARLAYQVKTLEEDARRDAVERATKSDVALVLKEVDLLRKDTEVGFAKMEARFATDYALLRKDMETQNLSIRKDMETQNLSIRKDLEAMQNQLIIKLGGIMVVALGAGAAIVKLLG